MNYDVTVCVVFRVLQALHCWRYARADYPNPADCRRRGSVKFWGAPVVGYARMIASAFRAYQMSHQPILLIAFELSVLTST